MSQVLFDLNNALVEFYCAKIDESFRGEFKTQAKCNLFFIVIER